MSNSKGTGKVPNVIFILADQHSAKALGFNGHPVVKTPALDRMAREGVAFQNAICQNPICTPSRVSWLSGQYCHNHGYYGLCGPHPQGLPTILGHFRRAGYRTGAIGKIHCPEYWVEDDCDTFIEARGIGCSIGGAPEYQKHLKTLGHDSDPDSLLKGDGTGHDGTPSVLTYGESQEKFIVERTKAFVKESLDMGKPFIVHTSFGKPHQPYVPAPEFWDMYNDADIQLPPSFDYDMVAGHKAPNLVDRTRFYRENTWTSFEPHGNREGALRKLRGYFGCVSQVDHAVGELIEWLKEQGLTEDTIVIYSADHGDYMAEQGVMEKAPGIAADAVTRIPYIWSWPGTIQAKGVRPEIVETVDLSQTLCSLCGLEKMETSDGKDISPLLLGNGEPVREIGVTEFALSKSLRKGKYRYVHYTKDYFPERYPDGFGELYDLEADPWEMKNLFFEAAYAQVVAELKDDLFDWLLTTTRVKTACGSPLQTGDQYITRYQHSVSMDGKINPDYIPRGARYS